MERKVVMEKKLTSMASQSFEDQAQACLQYAQDKGLKVTKVKDGNADCAYPQMRKMAEDNAKDPSIVIF